MSSTDMAIVVATRRQSRSRDARWAAELLRHTGVRIAGAVLVDRKGRGLRRPAHLAPVLPSGDAEEGETMPAERADGPGPRAGHPPGMDTPETPADAPRTDPIGNPDLDRKGVPRPG
jgi:Mrp family chromosome partitioning ATPase